MHKLKPEHFKTMEEAEDYADKLIEKQREMVPTIEAEHPSQCVPGFKLLDQFWYLDYQGLSARTQREQART